MAEGPDMRQNIQDSHWAKDKHARRKPDHPVVMAVFEPLAAIAASSIKEPARSTVLDVGCGNGFLQHALEKRFASVTGIDYSRKMLEVNPCMNKYLGRSTELPFSDRSFDVTVASNLLHHLSEADRVQTLSEMQRVARQAVVSFEPNRGNPFIFMFAAIKREEHMVLKFSPAYMRALFRGTGFSDIEVHVEGWIVPNKAPAWWIPIGRALGKTVIRRFGVNICTVGRIRS